MPDIFPGDSIPRNLRPKRLYRTRRVTELSRSDVSLLEATGGDVDPDGLMEKPVETLWSAGTILGVRPNGTYIPVPERMPLVPSVAGEEDVLWVAKNKNEWVKLDLALDPKFTYTKYAAGQEWIIQHDLDLPVDELRYKVIDRDGYTEISGAIDRTVSDNNKLVLLFAEPMAGKAFILK